MAVSVEGTEDPRVALDVCGDFLESRPVEHNVALTIVHERIVHPHAGRYWWTVEGGRVSGYAWHSPAGFHGGLTPMPIDAVSALVVRMAHDDPELPGVQAEAATAAAFAGAWTERHGTGAEPVEGQRLYRLDEVADLPAPDGTMRVATDDDVEQVLRWTQAFDGETGNTGGLPDLEATVRRRVASGWIWAWDDSGLTSMALVSPLVGGAARIGYVYTPPERRGEGYAQALVAALSRHALAGGADVCLLYTQLANATSNGIYRRIGYRAVGEVLQYRFVAS